MDKTLIKKQTEELRTILNEWDLLGVVGIFKVYDEYDCLNSPILSLLYKGADKDQIRNFLAKELIEHFGLTTNPIMLAHLDTTIGKIVDWWKNKQELVI